MNSLKKIFYGTMIGANLLGSVGCSDDSSMETLDPKQRETCDCVGFTPDRATFYQSEIPNDSLAHEVCVDQVQDSVAQMIDCPGISIFHTSGSTGKTTFNCLSDPDKNFEFFVETNCD